MTQPAPQLPPIQVGTTLMQTPAGPMAGLTISTGTVQFTVMIDDNQAADLARIFSMTLTEAAAAVRRAKLGLIVPGNGQPPTPGGLIT